MTYTSEQIAASTTPAASLMTRLNTLFTTAGFTFVETVVPSGTITADIYQSPASNSFGQAWYFQVFRTADAATSVSFSVAEAWNTTTKVFSNYPPGGSGVTPGANGVLTTTAIAGSGGGIQYVTINTAAVSTAYNLWFSATVDRVMLNTSSNTAALYMGLYDDILPAAMSLFPLCIAYMSNSAAYTANSPVKYTREYLNSGAYGSFAFHGTMANQPWGPVPQATSHLYYGGILPYRVHICGPVNALPSVNIRGFYKDMIWAVPTGAVNGDVFTTVDVSGNAATYTRFGDANNPVWLKQL